MFQITLSVKIVCTFRAVYSICEPVRKKLLEAAEVPPEQFRAILERNLETGDELWQIWERIPRDSKRKVCEIFTPAENNCSFTANINRCKEPFNI